MKTSNRVTRYVLPLFLILVLSIAVLGPLFADQPKQTVTAPFMASSAEHLLGSDGLGRDVFNRVLAGGAQLLLIAAISTAIAVTLGVFLGLALSFKSRLTRFLSWLIDLFIFIPAILAMMVIIFAIGAGTGTMIIVAVAVNTPFITRFTRALADSVFSSEYVAFAHLAGDSWMRVAVREVVPVIAGPLATETGIRFISAIYIIAAAGFLGLSPLDGDGDWATMVQSGLQGLALNPWASLAPALAIMAVTVPLNILIDRAAARSIA